MGTEEQQLLENSPSRRERYRRYRGLERPPAERRGEVKAMSLWLTRMERRRRQLRVDVWIHRSPIHGPRSESSVDLNCASGRREPIWCRRPTCCGFDQKRPARLRIRHHDGREGSGIRKMLGVDRRGPPVPTNATEQSFIYSG